VEGHVGLLSRSFTHEYAALHLWLIGCLSTSNERRERWHDLWTRQMTFMRDEHREQRLSLSGTEDG
jgi:hypothetical protein